MNKVSKKSSALISIDTAYFFIVLLIGFICMQYDFYIPYTPVILVVSYGLLVYLKYKNNYKTLDQKADMVYILGFVYTLIALLIIGINISEYEMSSSYAPFAIRNVSSAISTTIVGVIIKYVLNDYASTHLNVVDEYDYSHYLKQIAIAHKEFQNLHYSSMKMLSDYIKQRNRAIEQENEFADKYLNNLKKITQMTETLINDDFKKLFSNLKNCIIETNKLCTEIDSIMENDVEFMQKGIKESFNELNKSVNSVIQDNKNKLISLSEENMQNFNHHLDEFFININENNKKLSNDFQDNYSDFYDRIKFNLNDFHTVLNNCNNSLANAESQIQSVSNHSNIIDEDMKNLSESLNSLSTKISNLTDILDGYVTIVNEKIDKVVDTV